MKNITKSMITKQVLINIIREEIKKVIKEGIYPDPAKKGSFIQKMRSALTGEDDQRSALEKLSSHPDLKRVAWKGSPLYIILSKSDPEDLERLLSHLDQPYGAKVK
jgi:hypothetical protein